MNKYELQTKPRTLAYSQSLLITLSRHPFPISKPRNLCQWCDRNEALS
uniref:Uncharacterized protein n=1 Tax=Rhizophora mucronata TaxID=61149 RepID=A0A2P2LP59_RHIMU